MAKGEKRHLDLILTSLEVQNFRSLRNIKLEFDQEKPYLRLFIGKNDAGKSNILRAIRLVLSSERPDVADYCDGGRPIIINATLNDAESKAIYTIQYACKNNDRAPNVSWSPGSPGVQFEVVYIQSLRDALSEFKFGERSKNIFSQLIRPLLNDSVLDKTKTSLEQRVKELTRSLFDDLTRRVNQMLGRSDLMLNPNPVVKTSYDLSDIKTPTGLLYNHGHGTQSCVVMAIFDIYAEQARLEGRKVKNLCFLIEEPENHLHPELQRTMALRIQQLAEQYQVFVSTHSPFIVDRSTEIMCFRVQLNRSAGTEVSRVDTTSEFYAIISEIGARPSDLLQYDALILVEGPSDADIIREFLKLYSMANRQDLQHRVLVLFCGGSALYREDNERMLEELKMNTKFWVLIDSDRENEMQEFGGNNAEAKKRFKEVCNRLGVNLHVTDRREIENYFTEAAIKAVLGDHFDLSNWNNYADLKKVVPQYKKNRHPKQIAAQLKIEDIKGTDLWLLFEEIAAALA